MHLLNAIVFHATSKIIYITLFIGRIAQWDSYNPFPNKPWFVSVCSISLLKILREKKEFFIGSNFSFSHNVFYPFRELSAIFIQFKLIVCKPFEFRKSYICRLGLPGHELNT